MPGSTSTFIPRAALPAGPPVPAFLEGSPFAAHYAQQGARIPRGTKLEQASSDAIAGLLNPPAMFVDTARMAAERGASTGVPGSPNAFSAGLKMSDDERLRRIALGEQLFSAASARNPAVGPEFSMLTAGQTESARQADRAASLDEERLAMQKRAQELEDQLRALQIRNLGGGTRGGGLRIPRTALNDPLGRYEVTPQWRGWPTVGG